MGKATRWFRSLFGINKDKQNTHTIPNSSSQTNPTQWMTTTYDKEHDRHAITVAAATAAAADAAVAVVRLTSKGPGGGVIGPFNAAMKIQTVFRGYLARKARRALRGLVKLQALVRGYLVRKRAAATLQSMQALFRAQVAVHSQRARRAVNGSTRFYPESRSRRSIGSLDERSEFQSKRISASHERSLTGSEDTSPKIVEIDTCRPKSRSRRTNISMSEYGSDHNYQVMSSPHHHPCPFPSCLSSIPNCNHFQDDWNMIARDSKFATAHNTPRFAYPSRVNAPVTAAKSVCEDSLCGVVYPNNPSYMANTQSFRAKVRPHSAPKQRPELVTKRRLSLSEIMASRTSFTGVRMRRSCSQVQEEFQY